MNTQALVTNVQLNQAVNVINNATKNAAVLAADADTLPLTQKNIAAIEVAAAALSAAIATATVATPPATPTPQQGNAAAN